MAENIISKRRYCASTTHEETCKECGCRFMSTRRGHVFCSKSCWKKQYDEKRISPPTEASCRFCSKKFFQKTAWQAFCSASCRDKWHRNPESRNRVKNCSTCGVEFSPTKRWSQKYCSVECKKKAFCTASDKYRSRSRENGLCHSCGKKKLPHSSYLCAEHWFNKIASANGIKGRDGGDLVRAVLEAQKYRCPYTGRRLTPGLNASIDHKNPKSRFPNQIGLIDNIEWVDVQVNSAKREMTKDEFVTFCKLIALTVNKKPPTFR